MCPNSVIASYEACTCVPCGEIFLVFLSLHPGIGAIAMVFPSFLFSLCYQNSFEEDGPTGEGCKVPLQAKKKGANLKKNQLKYVHV